MSWKALVSRGKVGELGEVGNRLFTGVHLTVNLPRWESLDAFGFAQVCMGGISRDEGRGRMQGQRGEALEQSDINTRDSNCRTIRSQGTSALTAIRIGSVLAALDVSKEIVDHFAAEDLLLTEAVHTPIS